MSFVKFNNVYDLEFVNENCLQVKRVMFINFYKYIWAYTVEDIKIYVDSRIMEMKSEIIKRSSLFPSYLQGEEFINYRAFGENFMQTLYNKTISGLNGDCIMKKYIDKIN